MGDVREASSEVETIAQLRRDLDDMRSTLMARTSRCPTGDIEPTIRPTAKPDTLFLQGQSLLRSDYPVLWQWVVDQALTTTGFTAGNGSTTFTVPDMRGRVPVGAGTQGVDTYGLGAVTGATTKAIAIANLPSHNHSVATTLVHSGHSHANAGDDAHGGHHPTSQVLAASGSALGLSPWNASGTSLANHYHPGMSIEIPGNHTISESSVGSGTALDVRQAALAVNWMIWT